MNKFKVGDEVLVDLIINGEPEVLAGTVIKVDEEDETYLYKIKIEDVFWTEENSLSKMEGN